LGEIRKQFLKVFKILLDKMINKGIVILLFLIFISSCSAHRKIQGAKSGKKADIEVYCDTLKSYKSLYINKISAEITIGEEIYEAKVSVFYVPDSIFFVSAVNTGFEIVRIGIMRDSTVYINRLDKMVFIYKNVELGAPSPVNFADFELLFNRMKFCSIPSMGLSRDGNYVVDKSTQNITKKAYFSDLDFSLRKFEFFQKKTSEYVLGERRGHDEFIIYCNYIIDDLMLKTSGGVMEYDKEMNINLGVNKNKYETIYF
jgi:hypothetical protein